MGLDPRLTAFIPLPVLSRCSLLWQAVIRQQARQGATGHGRSVVCLVGSRLRPPLALCGVLLEPVHRDRRWLARHAHQCRQRLLPATAHRSPASCCSSSLVLLRDPPPRSILRRLPGHSKPARGQRLMPISRTLCGTVLAAYGVTLALIGGSSPSACAGRRRAARSPRPRRGGDASAAGINLSWHLPPCSSRFRRRRLARAEAQACRYAVKHFDRPALPPSLAAWHPRPGSGADRREPLTAPGIQARQFLGQLVRPVRASIRCARSPKAASRSSASTTERAGERDRLHGRARQPCSRRSAPIRADGSRSTGASIACQNLRDRRDRQGHPALSDR